MGLMSSQDTYIKLGMSKIHTLNLNDRPFCAIKDGSKRTEARVPTSMDTTPYHLLSKGDVLSFRNGNTGETLLAEVDNVCHYLDVLSMLRSEDLSKLLSSGTKDIGEAAKSFSLFREYEKNIPVHGIYAIHIGKVGF